MRTDPYAEISYVHCRAYSFESDACLHTGAFFVLSGVSMLPEKVVQNQLFEFLTADNLLFRN